MGAIKRRGNIYSLLAVYILVNPTTVCDAVDRKNIANGIVNEELLVDSIQPNPGDNHGNQGTKYSDGSFLKRLGYTSRSTGVEQSPSFCLDYTRANRVEQTVFTSHTSRAWSQSYCRGMDAIIKENNASGLSTFFFTDMVVFPEPLLQLYPEVGNITIQYNNWTEYLLSVMFDEWFERFPLTEGIVVRTGETYTFDTPFHRGSSPIASVRDAKSQQETWIRFLTFLREVVCVKHNRKVVFRTWFSLVDSETYVNVTKFVRPHKNLYMGVKHTRGDYFRQMPFNEILGKGNHAQVVEIQIQREYEGKGAYPRYLFEHVVFGDKSSGSNRSLSDLFPSGRDESSIVKGLMTWSRGGGWWGPYIHSAEFWLDLNLHLFVEWWNAKCTTTVDSVDELFSSVCRRLLLNDHRHGHGNPTAATTCSTFRKITLIVDQALLFGRYCLEESEVKQFGDDNCWIWTRDDRLGGKDSLMRHLTLIRGNQTRIASSLWLKAESLRLWKQSFLLYDDAVAGAVEVWNSRLNRQIRSSFMYAEAYFCVLESAWRALVYGVLEVDVDGVIRKDLLQEAIRDYDTCWMHFRASAVAIPEFPSIYKGSGWNFPFQNATEGMDATIDSLRSLTRRGDEEGMIPVDSR